MATKKGGSRSYFGTWGIISGPGYFADANDFPEGTIVEVTARVILPTESE
jgi:hypothetical protein